MPKIVDHEERRKHIADAVTQIIVRDGFDRVTMREIANEAGYAHGAITRYFPDKQSLLTAAFLQVFNASHERVIEQIGRKRGLAAMRIMSRELLPFEDVGSAKSRLVISFWDRAAQDQDLWDVHDQNITRRRGLIRRLLIEAQEDGELHSGINIEEAVNRISAYNAGWQMMAVLVPSATSDADLERSVDAMIAGLGTELSAH